MSELQISQLIKIILAVFVFVVVVIALGIFFKERVIDFFNNLPGGGNKLLLSLI